MVAGFGKQSLLIGSGPNCDIRLGGTTVSPEHARLVHDGSGKIVFLDLGVGPCSVDGTALPPHTETSFDFRRQFVVGSVAVPNSHPAIAALLMQRGQLGPSGGQFVIGRDPQRVHLVVKHPNVSGVHLGFFPVTLLVVDLGSTSGTWISGKRLAPQNPTQVEANDAVRIGPVPLSVTTLVEIAREFAVLAPPVAPDVEPAGFAPAAVGPAAARLPVAEAVEASNDSQPKRKHKTVIGQFSFGAAGQVLVRSIGRTPDNDIQISHPQVSSRHALLHRVNEQLFLEDRGSANGTYVRGQRIAAGQRVAINNGEKVFIGPMPLVIQVDASEVAVVVEDAAQWQGRPLYEIEAWDLVLQVPDRDNSRETKTLLDHVSFKALPGDLIALMGPSGAGKTMLLLTLNGYTPPTSGQVRINGEDLYSIYDALRGSIGYVPQDDIVHPELTVWEAVHYSARMRLPPDYSAEEIDKRVSVTLAQLGLENVAHLQIGRPEKKILSGGQRKRVNIAMELVTDPVILFLDEPTSGLAADDTTALVQLLADLARQTGKTIITTIHQPAKDEYEKFNLALIMGPGGIPTYFGPTTDGYRFFGSLLERQGKPNSINNPRDMFDMLNQRERPIFEAMRAHDPHASRFAARQQAACEWNAEFFNQQNTIFQKMYSGRRAVGVGSQQQGIPQRKPATSGQFGLLVGRYMKTKLRDVGGTAIMLLQAPIIGLLLAAVFGGQKSAIPYWCLGALQDLSTRSGGTIGNSNDVLRNMPATPDNSAAIFFLVVAAVWFGTSNAAREIVSERAIYVRERMVNLKLVNYVLSKFVLLSLFCVIQCTVLLAIAFFALGFSGGPTAFGLQLLTLVVTSMASAATGLLVSTMVASSEAAMALTPIALIPQVVLGGLMVPMTTVPWLKWPMLAIPARWGFQGVVVQERMAIAAEPAWMVNLNKPDLNSVDNFIANGKFQCAIAQVASPDLNGAWGFVNYYNTWLPSAVLGAMMVVQLLTILILLKRRDSV
jgi:ABC-type multidrug transport system ATPase subunit/pSer/pThr/pTyr-binding forkhead associated (FHA) protein